MKLYIDIPSFINYGKETITQTFECVYLPNGYTADVELEAVLYTSSEEWGKETTLWGWKITGASLFNEAGEEIEPQKALIDELITKIEVEI
ncbi:hypothetical protein [Riemerella columbipharyngis]|nr:hypothetical protein [Riemerella columbipharyngis]